MSGDVDTAYLRAANIALGSWEHAVTCLLGPRLVSDPAERRQRQALEIAAAALRLAGRADLVPLVLAK